jgi:hypothetical protein
MSTGHRQGRPRAVPQCTRSDRWPVCSTTVAPLATDIWLPMLLGLATDPDSTTCGGHWPTDESH